jgi:hypothetical protein
MQVISLYLLRAGYVRRLRCRRRRANAWWCRVIDALRLRRLQEAIVARPLLCRFSYPSIFTGKIVLQNSFFFQRPFWELPSRASGGSISGTSFPRNFFSSDRRSQVLCFLSFLSFFLYYVLFFAEARGIFVDGRKFVFLWIAWGEGFGFAPSFFS